MGIGGFCSVRGSGSTDDDGAVCAVDQACERAVVGWAELQRVRRAESGEISRGFFSVIRRKRADSVERSSALAGAIVCGKMDCDAVHVGFLPVRVCLSVLRPVAAVGSYSIIGTMQGERERFT